MGAYQITAGKKKLRVRHSEYFGVVLCGLMAVFLILVLCYYPTDSAQLTGIDFWAPLGILAFGIPFSLHQLFYATHTRIAEFDYDENLITLTNKSLIRTSREKCQHTGLKELGIRENHDDGYWFMPIVKLENGEYRDLGFGCPTQHQARSLIKRLKGRMRFARQGNGNSLRT